MVTGIGLLVFLDSPVWRVKFYQIFIQVSCLDAAGIEIICSTGQVSFVSPSHWIGLRAFRITLNPAVNPELTQIHDLSFIITDLNPVPQSPAVIVGGVMLPAVQLMPGETKEVEAVFHGILGVPAGTRATYDIKGLPEGVTASFFDVFVTLEPFGEMQVPHGMTMLRLSAASNAMVGESDATLTTNALPNPEDPNDPCSQPDPPSWCRFADESILEVEIIPLAPAKTPA